MMEIAQTAPAEQVAHLLQSGRLHTVGSHGSHGSHGCQVVWRQFGQGRPLVLLHGSHGSWLHWARNIEALAACRTVWVPDMPGYGESSATPEFTLGALLQRLKGSLDTLLGSRTPIDLAGFSFGGLVAAQLASRRGHVEHLALLAPAALQQVMRHNLLAHMLHFPASVDALALQIHIEACQATRFHSRPLSRAGGLQALLLHCARRLLLAWGEHDVTADPLALAPALATSHPHAGSVIVAGSGHWVQYEAATAINKLLGQWLTAAHQD